MPEKRASVGGVLLHEIVENAENGAICPVEPRTYHSDRFSGAARYGASP